MIKPEKLLEKVSVITGIPLKKLQEEWENCSHDGKRQVYFQLKQILKDYNNRPDPERIKKIAEASLLPNGKDCE